MNMQTGDTAQRRFSRRAFLGSAAIVGGSVVIGFTLRWPFRIGHLDKQQDPFDAWIHIHSDGHTDLVLDKSEMGQGVYTSLPMILAEEAELNWEHVSVLQSDASEGTGGSGSVYWSYKPLRQAGAIVRYLMIAAAAEVLGVSPSECYAKSSVVVHRPSGRRLQYGDLLEKARSLPLPRPDQAPLKDPKEFTLIGHSVPHLDIPAKVRGQACYGIDVRLPGMVFAVVAQCPKLRGTLLRYDDTKAKLVPGVLDVFSIPSDRSGTEIAVVGKTTWAAIQGRNALEVDWKPGLYNDESSESLRTKLLKGVDESEYWSWSNTVANPDRIPAAMRLESIYEFPFLAHTALEPMNTTVWLREGRCEVWAPTQSGVGVRASIAKALGVAQDDVTVHVTFMGGGFGRRFGGAYEQQVAYVAQRTMLPTQLVWTREDDFVHDEYRPACIHRMRGGIDSSGDLIAWSDRIVNTSIIGQTDPKRAQLFEVQGAVDSPYPAANMRVSYTPVDSGVPRGVWRGVPISFNCFAVECFIDELAHLAKVDPYLYRRRLLEQAFRENHGKPLEKRSGADWPQPDPARTIRMLELVTEKAGWGKPLGPNRGRGISCFRSVESYLAQVAEVTIAEGRIQVDRLVTVADCGQVVNMNGLRAQIEGGVLFGLSGALKERITVKDGGIEQTNFNAYDLLRMPDAPDLETYVVESDRPPGGIGEPPVALAGPSVANAVFAAVGKRLRTQPLTLSED